MYTHFFQFTVRWYDHRKGPSLWNSANFNTEILASFTFESDKELANPYRNFEEQLGASTVLNKMKSQFRARQKKAGLFTPNRNYYDLAYIGTYNSDRTKNRAEEEFVATLCNHMTSAVTNSKNYIYNKNYEVWYALRNYSNRNKPSRIHIDGYTPKKNLDDMMAIITPPDNVLEMATQAVKGRNKILQ